MEIIQGLITFVPSPWASKLDDHANILRCSYSIMQSTIDATTSGTLMIKKIVDETYNLIEEMTLNNFQLSNER